MPYLQLLWSQFCVRVDSFDNCNTKVTTPSFLYFNAINKPRSRKLTGLAIGLALLGCLNVPFAHAATENNDNGFILRVVSTPNPIVFPLLLAMSRNPQLPVSLVAVATGKDIVNAFHKDQGDALLSMTYTAADDVVKHKIPELQLVDVSFWRGFWMLAPNSAHITQFSQLNAQGVLVAGPVGGGKGGGPDLIFAAAVKRSNMADTDFKLCHLGVMQAAQIIVKQQQMNSSDACNPDYNLPPTAISMVEPAASGMVMESKMSGGSATLEKAIDLQTLFTGYSAWPSTELPHGGLSVLGPVLADPAGLAATETVLKAYREAVTEIMTAKGRPFRMMQVVRAISSGIATYYGKYNMKLPAPVIMMALRSGDLVYRNDLSIPDIQPDLSAFLTEVVGTRPPASFFHPLP